MLLLCHDLSCLICPLKTISPSRRNTLGTTLHVPAMAVRDLECLKGLHSSKALGYYKKQVKVVLLNVFRFLESQPHTEVPGGM